MKKILIAIITLLFVNTAMSQDLNLYEKHLHISGSDTLPYRLLLPVNYDPAKKYPLIYFLHGAGERGNDNEAQLVHGAGLFLRDDVRKNHPAIVVFPQCPRASFWSNVEFKQEEGKNKFDFRDGGKPTVAMKMAQELLQQLMEKYPVRKTQVYVGGLSMGGMGTFEIVSRNPGLFAAAFPICGGGHPGTASNLKSVKWWVFHGAKDNVVPPQLSEEMVKH
jgi:predicted peptidase